MSRAYHSIDGERSLLTEEAKITESFAVSTIGATLAGECGGSGRGVLFLHAGVADRRMWRSQLERFQDGYSVAAYDRRGFGETRYENKLFSPLDDLDAVLEHLKLESATLVGCSQGGRLAVDFALAYPNRINALALAAPAISGQPAPADAPPKIKALLDKLEATDRAGDIGLVNRIEAHLWLDGPESPEGRVGGAVRELFLDMNGAALRAAKTREQEPPAAFGRLGELDMPTLLVWGDLDFPHVKARCRHLAINIPRVQMVELRGAAHLPSLEQADTFNQTLHAFLEQHT